MPFRERVTAQLRLEGKHAVSPEELQAMILVIAQKVVVEEKPRALELECVRRSTGDKD